MFMSIRNSLWLSSGQKNDGRRRRGCVKAPMTSWYTNHVMTNSELKVSERQSMLSIHLAPSRCVCQFPSLSSKTCDESVSGSSLVRISTYTINAEHHGCSGLDNRHVGYTAIERLGQTTDRLDLVWQGSLGAVLVNSRYGHHGIIQRSRSDARAGHDHRNKFRLEPIVSVESRYHGTNDTLI